MQNKLITLDKQIVLYKDLGLIDYKTAWEYQEQLFQQSVDIKSLLRKKEISTVDLVQKEEGYITEIHSKHGDIELVTKHYLLICEHLPVLT